MAAVGDFHDHDLPHPGSGIVSENRFLLDAFLLALITFVSYLTLSWQFTGPTYLGDEIGYLSNAAALSGRTMDAASSYYFGYSLFLVPGFLLFDEPIRIWKAVLVTNALIFAGTVFLLHRISGVLSNERLPRFIAVSMCAVYPAYPTMAGHAFSTPGSVLLFVAACWTIGSTISSPLRTLLVFALLVGLLTWTHPTGLPVAIAAVMTLVYMSWLDRRLIAPTLMAVFVIALMIFAYQLVLQPMLRDGMTPEGYQPKLHYPMVLDAISALTSPKGLDHVVSKVFGQLAYVLTGSLALAAGVLAFAVRRLVVDGRVGAPGNTKETGLLVFGVLSLFGVIITTSVSDNQSPVIWANHWFNGRHLEAVLLPILLFGFLLNVPRMHRLIVTLVVFAMVFVTHLVNRRETLDINKIEVPSYWPAVILPDGTIFLWFLCGGLACILASFVPVRLIKVLLVGLYLYCIGNQIDWHHQSFWVNGRTSGLSQFLRDTYPVNSCIAFEPRKDRSHDIRRYERLNQLSYYLMNFNYRRMEVADWIENCDGPFLTYRNNPALAEAGAVVIAQELYTGLKAYGREIDDRDGEGSYQEIFVRKEHDGRSATHIVRVSASDLSGYLGVGELMDGSVVANSRSGHVFFGPYGYLNAGRYRFQAFGSASDIGETWFDLVSDGGNRIHHTFPLRAPEEGQDHLAAGAFEITEDLRNFEIRLNADANAKIVFSHYDLEMMSE